MYFRMYNKIFTKVTLYSLIKLILQLKLYLAADLSFSTFMAALSLDKRN